MVRQINGNDRWQKDAYVHTHQSFQDAPSTAIYPLYPSGPVRVQTSISRHCVDIAQLNCPATPVHFRQSRALKRVVSLLGAIRLLVVLGLVLVDLEVPERVGVLGGGDDTGHVSYALPRLHDL